jgi:hypothetical protein
MRRIIDQFESLKISPQRRYRLRQCAQGRCPDCGDPSEGQYRCARHRRKAARGQRKRRAGHPGNRRPEHEARRDRYNSLRKRGHSSAEARMYSSGKARMQSAPPPAPPKARTPRQPPIARLFRRLSASATASAERRAGGVIIEGVAGNCRSGLPIRLF